MAIEERFGESRNSERIYREAAARGKIVESGPNAGSVGRSAEQEFVNDALAEQAENVAREAKKKELQEEIVFLTGELARNQGVVEKCEAAYSLAVELSEQLKQAKDIDNARNAKSFTEGKLRDAQQKLEALEKP